MFPWILMPLTEKDVDRIFDIEQDSFLQPWPRSLFLEELASEYGWGYLVNRNNASEKEQPVAFIFFRLFAEEMHIFKIAVAKAWRRHKIASWLLERCFEIAVENHVLKVFLEVRYSNNSAIILYTKLGFQIVGRRPNYYSEPSYRLTGEDALVMMRTLRRYK